MRDDPYLYCRKHGRDKRCLGGESAHHTNWYCPECDKDGRIADLQRQLAEAKSLLKDQRDVLVRAGELLDKDAAIAEAKALLAVRIQESNEWEALARDRQEEIEAMRPMVEACKARYEVHRFTPLERTTTGVFTCYCPPCQWYRDYLERKQP